MNERIEKLIEALTEKRSGLLEDYLVALENYDGTMTAIEKAGLVHDIDKHITNLHQELSRAMSVERLRILNQSQPCGMEVTCG